METILRHEIRIWDITCELSRRKSLVWAVSCKVAGIFKVDIPNNMKQKAFNQCVLPVVIVGSRFFK